VIDSATTSDLPLYSWSLPTTVVFAPSVGAWSLALANATMLILPVSSTNVKKVLPSSVVLTEVAVPLICTLWSNMSLLSCATAIAEGFMLLLSRKMETRPMIATATDSFSRVASFTLPLHESFTLCIGV